MDELLNVLRDTVEDVDFENEEQLVTKKLLNSMDIIQIVNALDDEFGVEVPAREIVPENFNSMAAMWAMIERLRAG